MRLIRYAAIVGAALLCGCVSLQHGAPAPKRHFFGIRYGLASPAPLAAPQELNCIQSTATPCSSQSHVGSGDQGEPAWLLFGKLNDWGLQLGLFSNQPANEVEATPNGAAGIPSPRALVGADIPPTNLSLTGQNGGVTGTLGIGNGGTGTTTPGLVAGTNVTITGTWPNQTINSTGSGSGTVNSGTANQVGCYAASGTAISGCTTLPTAAMPAVSGDVTIAAGTTSAIVSKVSGVSGTPTTITAYNATSGTITISPPTGALGTLNLTWPSVSGIIPAITGTITTGDCAKFASATSITDAGACGAGGSGTINAALQYSLAYYSAAGPATTLSGLVSPTSGAGYYILRFDPTSGTAVAPTADQVGASTVSISGATSTYTVPYSSVNGMIVHDKAGSVAVTVTLPTPTTLNNVHFATNYCNNSAQTDTITPTTWTISLNNAAAAASISVASGICVSIVTDPLNAAQWDAFTYGAGSSGMVYPGAGIPQSTGTAWGTSIPPGTGVVTALGNAVSSAGGFTETIASGTATLGTAAIASGACATVVTVAATGVATTDVVKAGFNSDPTAVTGYGASATGAVLTIYPYPTAGNVNFKVCNSSSGSITPGAMTLNWRVTR